jgi:shikimate dehydrogenase
MDRYAVAGNPVEHSRSPLIHAEFAKATGQVLSYGRLLCPLDGFAGAIKAFAQADERGQARGCNVTVPFKFEAFQMAPRHTERAALAQAANALRFDAEGWLADNTDGVGLVRDIEFGAGVPILGKRLLLIGAGGAAAGVLGPLLAARPTHLVVANRTLSKAQSLVERHRAVAGQAELRASSLEDCAAMSFDVVINASASSLQGADIPVRAAVLAPGALAVDLMYGPSAEPFLRWAAGHGATPRDGLGMLVEQAAESFHLWRGVRPETAPVLDMLRQRMASDAAAKASASNR